MQKPLISVIIPVYNVEAYLERCVESVRKQTYRNLEILLVDDGSTDGSGSICDIFAQRDERVQVWHVENQGPSAARNLGIENARGDYLLFVDSDDMVSEDHVLFLYGMMNRAKADLAICNYTTTEKDTFLEQPEKRRLVWTGKKALEHLLYQRYFTTGPVCKLYRKALFETVRFPVGMLYEDTLAIAQVIGRANKVVYSDAVKYGYYQRPGSTMRSSYREDTFQYIEITRQLICYVDETFPQLRSAAISRYLWANIFVWIKMPCHIHDEKWERVQQNIKSYRCSVLMDPKVRVKNKMIILLSFFGQKMLQRVYQMQG